jgi:hypothetical protein
MRRKAGALIESEVALLKAAADMRQRGTDRFHGYLLVRELQELTGARQLTAHGTLYKTRQADSRSPVCSKASGKRRNPGIEKAVLGAASTPLRLRENVHWPVP